MKPTPKLCTACCAVLCRAVPWSVASPRDTACPTPLKCARGEAGGAGSNATCCRGCLPRLPLEAQGCRCVTVKGVPSFVLRLAFAQGSLLSSRVVLRSFLTSSRFFKMSCRSYGSFHSGVTLSESRSPTDLAASAAATSGSTRRRLFWLSSNGSARAKALLASSVLPLYVCPTRRREGGR